MLETNTFERLLLDNLPLIDRVSAIMARRQGLDLDEAADLASWVRLRLLEDDYAILRKFRSESAIGTYLTVVIAMLARDYSVQQRGRWRPSAAAVRFGPIAVRLETLMHRKGYRFEEAAQLLRTSGETTLTDNQLAGVVAKLPRREALRPKRTGEEPLVSIASGESSDGAVIQNEIEGERARVHALMQAWIANQSTEERLMLQMRFWQGMSVADIARALRVEQKPLYRQLDRLLARLRIALGEHGVTTRQFGELFEEAAS